jgi:DNA-binding MarR family transcriptional regulator
VPDDGITIQEFHNKVGFTPAGTKMWLTRLSKWWGYVRIDKSKDARQSNWLILPSAGGRKALHVWRLLAGEIEERWKNRFGSRTIQSLGAALRVLVHSYAAAAPDYLPILGFDLLTASGFPRKPIPEAPESDTLPCLLSKLLYCCATEFERATRFSFAICANVLRLAGEGNVPCADLPRLSGVSKEAIAMALKRIEEQGFGQIQVADTGKRRRVLELTEAGQRARSRYEGFLANIERQWAADSGAALSQLRNSLETVILGPGDGEGRLREGLEPCANCWRAAVPRPEALPHYPMVLHRGGFPDGS